MKIGAFINELVPFIVICIYDEIYPKKDRLNQTLVNGQGKKNLLSTISQNIFLEIMRYIRFEEKKELRD